MLEEAKEELKQAIIDEHGEGYYYKLIGDRIKRLHEFKESADKVFGRDDDKFKEDVILETIKSNGDLPEHEQLYDIVITEIALDVFLEEGVKQDPKFNI